MISILKNIIKSLLKLLPFPLSLKIWLIKRSIKFADALSFSDKDNLEFVISNYQGNLKVRVNVIYTIERVMISGTYEPHTTDLINRLLPRHGYAIDIGANVGALTLVMAKVVGPNGKVFAFEPSPLTFERLVYNIKLNPEFRNVIRSYNIGLSDVEETLYWRASTRNMGNGSLLESSGIPVPVKALDTVIPQSIPSIDFIKIDVEGMEYEVIHGGIETIKRYKPVICFEALSLFKERRVFKGNCQEHIFRDIKNLFTELNYGLFYFQPSKGILRVTGDNLPATTLAFPLKHSAKLYSNSFYH